MKYEVLTIQNEEEWSELMDKLPEHQQDIYFTPEYLSLLENNNEGICQCFVFYENKTNFAMYPFLKNEINELGYELDATYYDIQSAYGYGGIISSNFSQSFLDKFYKAFKEFCAKENIIAAFTRFHPLLNNHSLMEGDDTTIIKDRETVVINLTADYQHIWEKEYSSQNRNMIRKANKLGHTVQIIENPSKKELTSFIEIYHHTMRMVNAENYYFFKNEYYNSIFKKLSKCILMFNVLNADKKVICSSIFLKFGKYFHYHLSGRTNQADNTVNNILIDNAVKFSQAAGYHYFHLGGGKSPSEDDSLLKFKKGFSKQNLPFYIGKKILNTEVYNQVIEQWKVKYPEKVEQYDKTLLKYRY